MHLAPPGSVFLAVLLSLSPLAREGRAFLPIGELRKWPARAKLKVGPPVMQEAQSLLLRGKGRSLFRPFLDELCPRL